MQRQTQDSYQINDAIIIDLKAIARMESSEEVEYEVEKIEKKLTKKNSVWYLVKWKGYAQKQWVQALDLAQCQHLIDKFERKLQFKKELKGYVAQKKIQQKGDDKKVIVLDSEEEAKAIILISDSEEPNGNNTCNTCQPINQENEANEVYGVTVLAAANDADVNNEVNQFNEFNYQNDINELIEQKQNPPQSNQSTGKAIEQPVEQPIQQPIQDLVPQLLPNNIIEVPRYNYLRGEWEIVRREKHQLLTTALIRQVLQEYQIRLPPLRILRTFMMDGKKAVRFQCRNKLYQTHYDIIRKYRPSELVEYYEAKKDLFTKPKKLHFNF